jgi:hypothetical protein
MLFGGRPGISAKPESQSGSQHHASSSKKV